MAYKPREIEEKLVSKFGFEPDTNRADDHRWYVLQIDDLPVIRTHFSHAKKDIGPKLEGKIARQLYVRDKFFHEMIDCTKSLEDYIHQLRTDPFPPFPPYLLPKK